MLQPRYQSYPLLHNDFLVAFMVQCVEITSWYRGPSQSFPSFPRVLARVSSLADVVTAYSSLRLVTTLCKWENWGIFPSDFTGRSMVSWPCVQVNQVSNRPFKCKMCTAKIWDGGRIGVAGWKERSLHGATCSRGLRLLSLLWLSNRQQTLLK